MIYTVRDLTLDNKAYEVMHKGKEIMLSHREFLLLERLISNPNIVIPAMRILGEWEDEKEFALGTNVVTVYMAYLRKKLPKGYLHTVRGFGYKIK